MLSTHVAIASIPNPLRDSGCYHQATRRPLAAQPGLSRGRSQSVVEPEPSTGHSPSVHKALVAVDHDQYPRVGARELTETLPTEALVAAVESRGEGRKHTITATTEHW